MTDNEQQLMNNVSSLYTQANSKNNDTFLNSSLIEMGKISQTQINQKKKTKNKLGHLIPLSCGHNGSFN